MRRPMVMAALFALVLFLAFGSIGHAAKSCGGSDTNHTAAGSTKSSTCVVKCGSTGELKPVSPVNDLQLYANQTARGGEIEACADDGLLGSGNATGRAVLVVDSANGVRFVLDSTSTQSFPPGYITVQVGSPTTSNPTGVYCDNNPSKDTNKGADGYEQTWTKPGTQTGVPCVQQVPPVAGVTGHERGAKS